MLVVHAHDVLLAFGQGLDGVDQGVTQPVVAQDIDRVGLAVAQVPLEEAVLVVAAAGHVLQINQLGAPNLAQQGLVVAQAHAERGGNFALDRAAAELVLQHAHGLFDFALALA